MMFSLGGEASVLKYLIYLLTLLTLLLDNVDCDKRKLRFGKCIII